MIGPREGGARLGDRMDDRGLVGSKTRRLGGGAAGLALLVAVAGCDGALDLDLRDTAEGGLDTSAAALGAAAPRPRPDARGLITYPNYQVAVARRGDTVGDVAARVGVDADALARFNGVAPDSPLNADAVLALPGGAGRGGRADITTIAGAAIDRAEAGRPVSAAPAGPEPVRHRVSRGETAFSIARLYGVSVRSLADWNGLGSSLSVREGQFLLIPVVVGGSVEAGAEVASADVASPAPPSASSALPEVVEAEPLPPSPNLDQFRTEASPPEPAREPVAAPPSEPADEGTSFRRPVSGTIRAGFSNGNEGIDFAAAEGTAVAAAASGTVAAITRDTEQVPILVLRHADGLLTVYANIKDIAVEKGDTVSAGQRIASVGPGSPPFLHFELRRGLDAIDPAPFLR